MNLSDRIFRSENFFGAQPLLIFMISFNICAVSPRVANAQEGPDINDTINYIEKSYNIGSGRKETCTKWGGLTPNKSICVPVETQIDISEDGKFIIKHDAYFPNQLGGKKVFESFFYIKSIDDIRAYEMENDSAVIHFYCKEESNCVSRQIIESCGKKSKYSEHQCFRVGNSDKNAMTIFMTSNGDLSDNIKKASFYLKEKINDPDLDGFFESN